MASEIEIRIMGPEAKEAMDRRDSVISSSFQKVTRAKPCWMVAQVDQNTLTILPAHVPQTDFASIREAQMRNLQLRGTEGYDATCRVSLRMRACAGSVGSQRLLDVFPALSPWFLLRLLWGLNLRCADRGLLHASSGELDGGGVQDVHVHERC